MRVLKYLRGHIPAVALIVLLLVAQSFCELSLPAYTSRIVDTGIQSGGIEYAAPLALTDKTMDGVRLFLSDDDAAAVSAAYTDADGVWTINDTAQLPELEGIIQSRDEIKEFAAQLGEQIFDEDFETVDVRGDEIGKKLEALGLAEPTNTPSARRPPAPATPAGAARKR